MNTKKKSYPILSYPILSYPILSYPILSKALIILFAGLLFLMPACKKNTLKNCTTITDSRDGKTYKTVWINDQCWMAENLNFDATGIHDFCYDDLPENCDTCGRLYPYDQSGVQICPEGWHVPTKAELYKMVNYLGGSKPAKDKMLPGGSSGFNLKKCGSLQGPFYTGIKNNADMVTTSGTFRILGNLDSVRHVNNYKAFASCRCLKDEK